MTNTKGITLYYAPNNQEQLHGIMTIVGKNNDPPLSIEPYESEECNSDICGFPDYETMVKAFVNTKKRVNGGTLLKFLLTIIGVDFQIGVIGKQIALELSIWYNATAFNRNPFIPFDPDQIVPYDHSMPIQRAIDEALSKFMSQNLTHTVEYHVNPSLQETKRRATGRFAEFFQQTTRPTTVRQRNTLDEYKRITLDIGKKPFPDLSSTVTIPKDIVVQLTGPAFFFMAMFLLTIITHYTINLDRSANLRLAMQHHDLKDFSYWTSWVLWAAIINFLATILMVCFGKVSHWIRSNN